MFELLLYITSMMKNFGAMVLNDFITKRLFKIASIKRSFNFVSVPKCCSCYIGVKLNI